MKSLEITDTNINETLSNDGITVLDFWAEWCGPCRILGPIIEQLAENNEDINVGKVNVDSNKISAVQFGIRGIPTMIFFKDGKEVSRLSGIQSLPSLQKIVDEL